MTWEKKEIDSRSQSFGQEPDALAAGFLKQYAAEGEMVSCWRGNWHRERSEATGKQGRRQTLEETYLLKESRKGVSVECLEGGGSAEEIKAVRVASRKLDEKRRSQGCDGCSSSECGESRR